MAFMAGLTNQPYMAYSTRDIPLAGDPEQGLSLSVFTYHLEQNALQNAIVCVQMISLTA